MEADMWEWFFGNSDDEPTDESALAGMIACGVLCDLNEDAENLPDDQYDAYMDLHVMAYGDDWDE
jgi:hypothetical protein